MRERDGRAQHSLFPGVEREEIERLTELLDHASEAMAIWRRGHTLMGLIQSQVYHQRSNWVKILAEAMRMALWDVAGKTPSADYLGVPQSMVSQIENGKRPIPDELVPPLMTWLAADDND